MPPRDNRHGLAFKLALLILSCTAVIFISAFAYNYLYTRDLILQETRSQAAVRTQAAINRIETILQGVEKVPLYLSRALGTQALSASSIERQVEDLLEANGDVFGSAVAFEPYAFDRKTYFYAPYISREGGAFKRLFLGDAAYNYLHMDWYQIPKELKQAVWSEPYFDEGAGNIAMATYSVPFYRLIQHRRTFMGVVTADVSLEGLVELISRLLPERMGFAFLISRNGVFLSHPNKAYPMQESIFSIPEANADEELRRVGRQMIEGGEGFVPVDKSFTGQRSWMYYAPLPSVGWSIGLVFPESTLFAEITLLTRNVVAIGATGFLILFVAIIVISGAITRPLRQLAARAGEIARGNLEIDVPAVTSRDEVGELSRSFREMKDALKEYISDLAETTAAKERIESELKIAHTIQMSFLPKKFPPFPEKDAFEIYAALEPAKEVGGDLYDFFLLDDDHLFFSIGDVSGKGVPAALFMAVTKTLVKGIAKHDMTPAQTLASVNAELVIDNDSSMFVTVFCAVLNFRTGELAYCSAGHNPPLLLPAGEGPRWLEVPPDFLLGVLEDASYRTTKISLAPGDVLLLYTDGVTEAMNEHKAFFSEGALLDAVGRCVDRSPRALVTQLLEEVKAFAGNEPQSDDITLLALRFQGRAE